MKFAMEQKRKEAVWDLFQSESNFLRHHLMALKNVSGFSSKIKQLRFKPVILINLKIVYINQIYLSFQLVTEVGNLNVEVFLFTLL